MKILFRVDPPYQWVKYDGEKVDSFGEVSSLAEMPLNEDIDHHIGVVDGDWVSVHKVVIPAKTKKQMAAAAPYALEEHLVDDIDDLHFTILDWVAGEYVLMAVVAKEKMRAIIQRIREAGIDLDQLIPENLLLPIHDAANHTVVATQDYEGEPCLLVRSRHQVPMVLDENLLENWLNTIPEDDRGVAVNSELLAKKILQLAPDVDPRHWPIGDRMAYWFEYNPDFSTDLLGEQFTPVQSGGGAVNLRWAAALLGVAFALKLIFDGYEYFTLWNEDRRLNTQMANILQTAFPEVTKVIPTKERFMMQQQIDRLQGNSSTLGQFQEIVAAVAWARLQTKIDMQISDMRFRSGELIVTCLLKDFAQVDQLTQFFVESEGIVSELSSSSSEGGKVSARYKLKRRV